VVAGLFNIGDSLLTPLQLATTSLNFTDKIIDPACGASP